MSTNATQYDKKYYDSYKSESCMKYERGNGWEDVFKKISQNIVSEINPKSVLDVGCAFGFLVEALRDSNVEAYGIDVSDYAISQVRDDIKEYCKVQNISEKLQKKYDLITCIEVVEHIDSELIPIVIENICNATENVIFSSTPFEYEDETHISVHGPEYWAEQFCKHGFYHDINYDCSYISVQAMRFRKGKKTNCEIVREYERMLFEKHQENVALRKLVYESKQQKEIYQNAYNEHVDMINNELNPKIHELEGRLKGSITEDEHLNSIKEIENRCRMVLENEIVKRKYYEERYYEYESILSENQRWNSLIDTNFGYRNKPISKSMGIHFLNMKRDVGQRWMTRKLLKKPVSYWKEVFDAEYYSNNYEDLANVFGNDEKMLLRHFIMYGMYEGRKGSKNFDVARYIANNPDLVDTFLFNKRDYYLHYIDYGRSENRKGL